ncbi:hypothetical protein AAMO2058_000704700 [Amorphochlora amoebiformis]
MRAFVFPAFVLLCFAAVGSHGWFFGSKREPDHALMVDGFEAVDLELPLSDWKAMEVFVRSKEIVEREGLMPCVELVQGRCHLMEGEATMRMAFEIMNCHRKLFGHEHYTCPKHKPFRDCLRQILTDTEARSLYTTHESNIATYCEIAQPGYIHQLMLSTLIRLGNATMLSVRLQKYGNKMSKSLVARQATHLKLLDSMGLNTQNILEKQNIQLVTMRKAEAHQQKTLHLANQVLRSQESQSISMKLMETNQAQQLATSQSILDKNKMQVEAQKQTSELLTHLLHDSKKAIQSHKELQEGQEKLSNGQGRVLNTQKRIMEAQKSSLDAVDKANGALTDSLKRQENLIKGQKRQMELTKSTLGYLERSMTILRAISDSLSKQTITVQNIAKVVVNAHTWFFIITYGIVFSAVTSTQKTHGTRGYLAIAAILYWCLGDPSFLSVWISRTLFLTLSAGFVLIWYLHYKDDTTRLQEWMEQRFEKLEDPESEEEAEAHRIYESAVDVCSDFIPQIHANEARFTSVLKGGECVESKREILRGFRATNESKGAESKSHDETDRDEKQDTQLDMITNIQVTLSQETSNNLPEFEECFQDFVRMVSERHLHALNRKRKRGRQDPRPTHSYKRSKGSLGSAKSSLGFASGSSSSSSKGG